MNEKIITQNNIKMKISISTALDWLLRPFEYSYYECPSVLEVLWANRERCLSSWANGGYVNVKNV